MAAGKYTFSVSASGYADGSGTATVTADPCQTEARVTLTPLDVSVLFPPAPPATPPAPLTQPARTGVVTGSICPQSQGETTVTLTMPDGSTRTAQISAGGSYQFDGLAAGTYTVSAGGDSQTLTVGGDSPWDLHIDFCLPAPAAAPPAAQALPQTGGPVWPAYAGGSLLVALGLLLRRRSR